MSTRATYQIDGHTFYIHSDGYPEGAAFYFGRAVLFAGERGGFAETFLRANGRAEFTKGHDHHGDTEYRYDYNSTTDVLTVKGRNFSDGYANGTTPRWRGVFAGALVTFLNAHHVNWDAPEGTDQKADRGLWVKVTLHGTGNEHTYHLAQVSLSVKEKIAGIATYRAQFNSGGWSGNAGGMVTQLCGIGGELLQRLGQYDVVLALATDYYDTSLVTMGHPADRTQSGYWNTYLGGLLAPASKTEAA